MTFTYLPALPEIFLAAAGLALLMVGVFQRGNATESVAWLSVLALIVAGILLLYGESGTTIAFRNLFVVDAFARFMKILVLAGAALAIIMSLDFIAREGMRRFEFPVLMLFATLGMLMMLSANDLISLYVSLELQSLALYVVAAFQRDSERSTEAGLKYFVLGALSSGMLLYGASMVYGFAGTTSFVGLAKAFSGLNGPVAVGLIVGVVFVVAGLAFKVSAVPFHMWTPDVYEGAPTPVTAFFAAAPKLAATGLLIRVMVGPFYELRAEWLQILWFIAVTSMILGAVAAINQTNFKRLMAYSSIGNIGYALVGLVPGTEIGVRGVLIYMAIYLVMTIGSFGCILLMRQKGRMVEGIYDLAGLSKTNPLLAAALAVFMFSMAGVPWLAGFFGKFYVFLAAVQAGLYWLAVIGVVTSVISAFYYLRIVKVMYFDEPAEPFDRSSGWSMNLIIGGTSLLIFFFFVFAGPVLSAAQAAAMSLFPVGG